jgi:hypothetical protein
VGCGADCFGSGRGGKRPRRYDAFGMSEAIPGMDAAVELYHGIGDLLWQTRRCRTLLRGYAEGKAGETEETPMQDWRGDTRKPPTEWIGVGRRLTPS